MDNTVSAENAEERRHSRLADMIRIALMCSVMCVLCPFAVPAGPIPVTLGVFAVYLAVYVLGGLRAAIACLLYVLLGALGLPVFSGYAGGLGKLLGPTGGYLIGYVFLALIAGWFFALAEKTPAGTGSNAFVPRDTTSGNQGTEHFRLLLLRAVGMILGLSVCYLFGTLWFTLYKSADGMTFAQALTVCVVPFLPFDALKIIAALAVGGVLSAALKKAHLV